MNTKTWKTIGQVGVDSGTIIIGDPCHITNKKINKQVYDNLLSENSTQIRKTFPFQAVAFHSGMGDGIYAVKARIKNYGKLGKKIAEIRMVLIE